MEHGDEAGDTALHDLLEDDVGGVEAGLGAGLGRVLDLDHERRPVGGVTARVGQAGERGDHRLGDHRARAVGRAGRRARWGSGLGLVDPRVPATGGGGERDQAGEGEGRTT